MADLDMLRLVASRTGLGLKYLSKDEKISIALEQLREIFPDAIFKGGTALNRVYLSKFNVSRFSEDIDLDILTDGDLDDNARIIREGMSGMKGFEVAGPRKQYRTLRFDCGYESEIGGRDLIKIDFYVNKPRSLKVEERLVKSPFMEAHSTMFKVYSLEDLIAQKLAALYGREEGKDVYDLFYALDAGYDKERLLMAIEIVKDFYHIEEEDYTGKLIEKLEGMKKNSKYIRDSTSHFIPSRLRPEWKIMIDTLGNKLRDL